MGWELGGGFGRWLYFEQGYGGEEGRLRREINEA